MRMGRHKARPLLLTLPDRGTKEPGYNSVTTGRIIGRSLAFEKT